MLVSSQLACRMAVHCADKTEVGQRSSTMNMTSQDGASLSIDEPGILQNLIDLSWLDDVGGA